ncbi:DUF2752 domain-containing protein [Anaerophaga thermohalophila]|jgi:hypothetical protein|uniref:DUF2752 domain-containing protein n=1 Tax=Anaerophaga thermohalophila TaxID=177400 RepID=UPI0002E5A072|nr:DUF2752 domain-containing protein [Anaerophaga thermohalophila]
MKYIFHRKHVEAFIWIGGLLSLAITDPSTSGHLSLCPLKNAGFDFCPGCGLGHSVSWLFRGNLTASFQSHPLGIPAVIILLARSFNLLKNDVHFKRNINAESQ